MGSHYYISFPYVCGKTNIAFLFQEYVKLGPLFPLIYLISGKPAVQTCNFPLLSLLWVLASPGDSTCLCNGVGPSGWSYFHVFSTVQGCWGMNRRWLQQVVSKAQLQGGPQLKWWPQALWQLGVLQRSSTFLDGAFGIKDLSFSCCSSGIRQWRLGLWQNNTQETMCCLIISRQIRSTYNSSLICRKYKGLGVL